MKTLAIENLFFEHDASQHSEKFLFQLSQFAADPSDVIVVRGKSGSGKSTFFDLLAGFLEPKTGLMTWREKSMKNALPQDRPISYQMQGDGLFANLTVQKNLLLALHDRDLSRAEKLSLINSLLLECAFSENVLDKKPSEVSGGENLRLNVIRALLRPRAIMIFDEPFAKLDAATSSILAGVMKEQFARYRPLVFISDHSERSSGYFAPVKTLNIENGQGVMLLSKRSSES